MRHSRDSVAAKARSLAAGDLGGRRAPYSRVPHPCPSAFWRDRVGNLNLLNSPLGCSENRQIHDSCFERVWLSPRRNARLNGPTSG